MAAMAGETNAVRLETAFRVAETELGVARLLDPEVRRRRGLEISHLIIDMQYYRDHFG